MGAGGLAFAFLDSLSIPSMRPGVVAIGSGGEAGVGVGEDIHLLGEILVRLGEPC